MKNYNDNDNQLRSTRTIAFEGWGNLFFAVIGLAFFLLGTGTLKFDGLPYEVILNPVFLTLGVTFLSNSIFNFIRFKVVSPDENMLFSRAVTLFNQLKLQKDYGLVNIFKSNTEASNVIVSELKNIYQNHNGHERFSCDIICNGNVAGFAGENELNNIKDDIRDYLQKGFSIRMIVSNYKLNHLAQLHVDSTYPLEADSIVHNFGSAYTNIKKSITELMESFNEIMRRPDMHQENIGKIDIKFTNCLPVLQYHRVGNKVFVSSRMIGNEYTSTPIVHEYEKTKDPNDAFHLYESFFNNLWNNPNFSWHDKNLSTLSNGILPIAPVNSVINPHLVIGDVIIDRVMRMTCNALVMILRTVNPSSIGHKSQPVRAFFTVVNCTPKNEDGVIRRYNVHAVDRINSFELINLEKINNHYEVNLHHAIGKAIITGRTVFRTINKEYEPSAKHIQNDDWGKAVVSISVPINANVDGNGLPINYYGDRKGSDNNDFKIIKGGHTKTIATLTFEFNEETQALFGIPDDKINTAEYDIDAKESGSTNRRIKDAAIDCAKFIIEYLGLDASTDEHIEDANPNLSETEKNPSFLDSLKKKVGLS